MMGSYVSIEKCPRCGYFDEEHGKGFIVDTYTNGEVFAGCENCDYGYKILRAPVCRRCGYEIWHLLASIDDLWMIYGLRHCPVCNSPFVHWIFEEFPVRTEFIRIPSSELRPIDELVEILKGDEGEELDSKFEDAI